MAVDDGPQALCDYCRQPLPEDPLATTLGGETYRFCTAACRDAMDEREHVFTEYHGFRRLSPGVSALERALPEGLHRNSMVLLASRPGTRDEALKAELAWRTLQRGEPAVVLSFLEPPVSVVQEFLSLGWNVLPHLEAGRLHLVDCFTYRVDDRPRLFERMNDWNRHLHEVAADETTTVRDPSDTRQIANQLDNCLGRLEMMDSGVVVVDSLTELGTLVQPDVAYDLVKDVRADVCKGRFVPVFAGAAIPRDGDEFPHDLEYAFDGIVDLELVEVTEDEYEKELLVRKMSGVPTVTRWLPYRFARGAGLVELDADEGRVDDPVGN